MTDPGATTTPRRGVLRLVVLALTLAGFVAMHGVAANGADGAHCGAPAAILMAADAHPAEDHPAGGQQVAHHGSTRADAPAPARDSHGLMIGCLLALLGTLVAIGLRLLAGVPADTARAHARQAPAWLRAARAPPDPLFLSLCVFRL